MKTFVILVILAGLTAGAVVRAGNLQPPVPPAAGGTMKTLDQIEPGTTIHAADLPLTITESGSYYFTQSINYTDPNYKAITIAANDVAIDLRGFSLRGPGSAVSSDGCGIYATSMYRNITISNGTIRGFEDYAIYVYSDSVRIKNIRAYDNGHCGFSAKNAVISNCSAGGNGDYGFMIYNSILENCTANGNTGSGVYVGSSPCRIINCAAHANGNYGFYAYYNSLIKNSVAARNGSGGFYAKWGGTMQNCTAVDNGQSNPDSDGIYAYEGCTIVNCTSADNARDGIRVDHGCRIEGGSLYSNDNYGLYLVGAGNYAVANIAGSHPSYHNFFNGAGAGNYMPTTGDNRNWGF